MSETCPNCGSWDAFSPSSYVGSQGRQWKCLRCSHEWNTPRTPPKAEPTEPTHA
jgi:predicted Zn finger-like uncharacterized protein